MAFHVACPITCRKICFCALGFPRKLQSENGRNEFVKEVARVEQFLNDPWLIKARENATIQVKVPKVIVAPALPPPQIPATPVSEDAEAAQMKRVTLQKQGAAASIVAEDYARRFESGDLAASTKQDVITEEQGQSNAKVMCRLCFSGENEGSERARKMLPCNTCGKKYHRNCLKSWSQNRDLFHWSSWSCPSCRTCEVCRRTGDPNKFMFCKRCDDAHHCYCQQPPHKNVGHGPYLCPKHTKCHSCGSSVPGNGLSVRWFLGYTCCDACGRLFVKGNYCPVCLKVYRDSESTPMVCCDTCERWVHCPCDGISDAKYQQFQVDGNLQYVCPTCRGECHQIRNLEEAVLELWRRRDETDKELIAKLRAAAGLPTQEEIFDISPFSDDDETVAVVKNEYTRSLKFSLKGTDDKSPRKSKEYGKKSSKKKYKKKGNKFRHKTGDSNIEETQFSGEPVHSSHVNEAPVASKHKYVEEVTPTNGSKSSRTLKIKSNKSYSLISKEEFGNNSTVTKPAQGPKLVIHLGGHNRTDQVKSSKIKIKNPNSEVSSSKLNGPEFADVDESVSPKNNTHSLLGKRNTEDDSTHVPSISHASSAKDQKPFLKFKIPSNSTNGSQTPLPLAGKEEITYTRGQRSKRRRPAQDDEEGNPMKEFTDANWVLQKLGKDAAGKRVEVHQASDNSWNRGTVVEVFEDTSIVSIAFDGGKPKNFELGKQGIRFVPQKQKGTS